MSQVKILIYIIHFISVGDIPLSEQTFDSISKAKKSRFISTKFKEKAKVKRLIQSGRKKQLEDLLKISSLIGTLLTRLFKKKEGDQSK